MPIQPKSQPPYYNQAENVKTYLALLTQTGTDAPTATILQNTLSATPVWTRSGTGAYVLTLTGEFTENKTTIITQQMGVFLYTEQTTANTIILTTRDSTFTLADECLLKTTIHIIVYP